jgi:hypothetical protein
VTASGATSPSTMICTRAGTPGATNTGGHIQRTGGPFGGAGTVAGPVDTGTSFVADVDVGRTTADGGAGAVVGGPVAAGPLGVCTSVTVEAVLVDAGPATPRSVVEHPAATISQTNAPQIPAGTADSHPICRNLRFWGEIIGAGGQGRRSSNRRRWVGELS